VPFGDPTLRRHPVDDVRQCLCELAFRLATRHAELLGDVLHLALAEDLRQHAGVDRKVFAAADPRLRVVAVAGLLHLAEHALQTAVLHQKLQDDLQQRIRGLRAHAGATRRLRLPAAHHAAENRVE
jgi:hypothetical protein